LNEYDPGNGVVIVKIGGSVLTFKEKFFEPRTEIIAQLAQEIKNALPRLGGLILVHGGGSFGHPVAAHYLLQKGYASNAPAIALTEVEDAMRKLNGIVEEGLARVGLPVFTVQTSAVARARQGKLAEINTSFFSELLSLSLIPITYGSLIFDETLGYTIVSGDDISVKLAVGLGAKSLIFVSDVDGLYDRDPKIHPDAKLLRKVSLTRDHVIFGEVKDVTGGIRNKVENAGLAVSSGVAVRLINGLRRGNLYAALNGEDVGTEFIE